jgi:hypothetical protein
MSWHFSQALVAEYLAENSSAGEQYAPSSGKPIQGIFWSPDKTMETSKPSRSGMTFKPSTDDLGADLLTWFLADFRAKTSAQPEKVQESKESDHPCGNTWRESSVRYCRNTSSWKTHRCLWDEDLAPSSLTLPKWGMMQSGVLWERITSPLHTDETESGLLLPTPTCADATMGAILNDNTKLIMLKSGKLRKISNQGVSGSIGLARTVAMWPTPQAHKTTESGEIVNADGTPWDGLSKPHSKTTGRPITTALADAVKFATPQARDFRTGQQSRWDNPERTRNLNDQIGGQLNPTWVEKLMGWPQKWTEAKPMIDFQFISWIMGFCECENTRTKEVMRVLRNSNGAENFQRKVGRPIGIQEAEILLSLMFQHEIGSDEAWLLMEGAEAPQGEVRGVRIHAGVASSPHRPGHQEQPAGEYSNAMQTLPRLLAYDGEAAWKDQSWENAVPRVATGVAARVDRLKAIGNGQVPQAAALAWRSLTQDKP